MRETKLNDEVTVTLPAHIWNGFVASYQCAPWSCQHATAVAQAAQEALIDPVYLREQEAEMQQMHAEHGPLGFLFGITGQHPQVPPDTRGLEDTD
jgi:hypothetical protein